MESKNPVETSMRDNLQELQPLHLQLINESHMHNVPKGSESHFKVIIVSNQFMNRNLVARHRIVNSLLKSQIEGPVHALSIHAMTPDEWFEKEGDYPDSPACLGGNKL
ncbi:MAG: BolA family transcriptional regulator [Gammaproteobacteria bacterium]|nr:BolA family transcriptional regulator [Gammaproteobacteria bacterium]MCY4218097.1 BolA family transcriptional regulator [Gammaproteobacteria bacterium]MCY4274665.1 BolA family transcriptional regulator [Gammaproteobacteria bacterium]